MTMANLFNRFTKKTPSSDDVDPSVADSEHVGDDAEAGQTSEGHGDHKRGLFGRVVKKKGNSTGDDQLSSVVDESEPGAVLDRMNANTPFVLPEGMGYVIPVLPTKDPTFGGLSKRENKDPDKGNILNLINSDVINSVVTPDLLDDNALGFVPNTSTLERMNEYGILRNARYFYGVATADPDTGDVFVYLVPPKREESASGKIFDEIAQVSRGRLVLEDVVDFDLIAAMHEIFHAEGENHGADGVFYAMELNTEKVIEAKRAQTYPTSEALVQNLIEHFPEVLGDEDDDGVADGATTGAAVVGAATNAAKTDGDADTEVENDAVDADAADVDDTEVDVDAEGGSTVVTDADDDTAEASDSDDAEIADDAGVDTTNSTEEEVDAEDADDVADADGTDNADADDPNADDPYAVPFDDPSLDEAPFGVDPDDDYDAPFGDGVQVSDAQPAQTLPQDVVIQLQDMLANGNSLTNEQFSELMQAVTQSSEQLMDRIDIMEAEAEQRELARRGVYTPEDEGFDRDSINEGMLRRYDDSLDLYVDAAPFNSALGISPRQIYEIQSDIETPWLRDQLNRIAVDLNTRMVAVNQANAEERQRTYLALVTELANDITEQLAYDNDSTPWYGVHKSIEDDKEAARLQFVTMVDNRRKELREDYAQGRETYINSRMAQAGEDYDRLNTPQFNAKMAAVESELMTMYQTFGDELDQRFNMMRREEAKRRFNLGLTTVITSMGDMYAAHDKAEAELFDEAHKVIERYINEHREDDIKQAMVWEDKLAKDTRLQDAIDEYEIREEKILADAEDARERFNRQLDSEREMFNAQMQERDQMAKVAQQNADARIEEARSDARRAQDNADARIQEIEDHMKRSIQNAEDRALQAEANAEAFIEAERSERSVTIIILVVVAVVMMLAGVGLGYFVL